MLKGEDVVRSHKERSDIIWKFILFSFFIILIRLWYLQIYRGDDFYNYSIKNILRRDVVRAPRGKILSRNDGILAHNMPRFDAVITPQYLKNKQETIDRLSKILDIPEKKILAILSKNSVVRYRPVIIKKNLQPKELALIETENLLLPGVSVDVFSGREYPDVEIGAHLLGYISEISPEQLPKFYKQGLEYQAGDFVGQAGVEYEFDSYLKGINGEEYIEVDARGMKRKYIGEIGFFEKIQNITPIAGKNLKLTIDQDLQISAFNALEGKTGAVVVLEVNSGEVLAMVSRPSFDPSKFSQGLSNDYWNSIVTNKERPMRDRTVQEHYPPGSVFKIFALIAGLEEKIIDENTEFNCSGKLPLGRRVFHCWKKHGHGSVNALKAIRESCDIYFYKVAQKLDIDVLARYAKMFGLGEKTNITLSREVSGLIPTKQWKMKTWKKEWALGETLSCIIGQSYVLATPLQLALSYSMIANGGYYYRPYVVKSIMNSKGEAIENFESKLVRKVNISEKTLEIARRALIEVMNNPRGTGWWQRGVGNAIAGKTGTSQVIRFSSEKIFDKCIDFEYSQRHHGLFVGYAPYDDPKIAVAAVVEHGCSSKVAIPVVSKVVSSYLEKYYPEIKEKYTRLEKIQLNSYYAKANEEKKAKEAEVQPEAKQETE